MLRNRNQIQVLTLLALGFWLSCSPFAGAQQIDLTMEINSLLSRLQSMGHGYYSEDDWAVVFRQIDEMSVKAEQNGAWESLVEINLIKSMVLSDMRNDPQGALALLQQTRKKFSNLKLKNLGKTYIREAEIYSKEGDEAAITRVMDEFRKSPYYDAEGYSYSGGWGRDVPLAIVRPSAQGQDSVSMSTMEVYRNQSRFSLGKPFPDVAFTDTRGNSHKLSDFRGKVVLLDFWATGWEPWKRALPQLVATYNTYTRSGFQVIGINLEINPVGLDAFLSANRITWPQVVGNRKLPQSLGIFGEATNFLIDQNGQVIGRNLKDSELTEAVKRALGI